MLELTSREASTVLRRSHKKASGETIISFRRN